MIKYDTWQVFWLEALLKPSHSALVGTVVKLQQFYYSLAFRRGGEVGGASYSYGDSAGITPASLLILRIEAEKPNSLQMYAD